MYTSISAIFLFFSFSLSSFNFDTHYEDRGANESKLEYPRIMWSFYDREMPAPIKEMFDETVKNVNNSWKFFYLTYDNLSLYLNTSTFPSHLRSVLPAQQSDYIRMRLLEQYGGWWIDTALIINNNNIMEEFYDEIVEKKAEFFGVCNLQCPRKLIEDGFIYAPKGSIVIRKWREEMEKIHKVGQKNYIYNTYRSGVTIPFCLFEPRYPKVNPYMTAFAAEQKVLDRLIPRNTSLVLRYGNETLYKWLSFMYSNNLKYEDVYYNKKLRRSFPLIKINTYIRRNLFKGQGTVTAYDAFYEPHPLIKGMSLSEERMDDTIIQYTLFIIFHIFLFFSLSESYFFVHNKKIRKDYFV